MLTGRAQCQCALEFSQNKLSKFRRVVRSQHIIAQFRYGRRPLGVCADSVPAAGRGRTPDVLPKSLTDHDEESCMNFASEQADQSFEIIDILS